MPENQLLIAQEILLVIAQLFLTIILPMERCFTQIANRQASHMIEKFIAPFILIASILTQLNKGYYDEGMIIADRSKIVKRYTRMNIWLELLNLASVVFRDELHIIFVFLAALYRFDNLIKVWEKIDEFLEISHRMPTISQIIELACLIFLIAHLCACGFFLVSKIDTDSGVTPTWIIMQKINDADW